MSSQADDIGFLAAAARGLHQHRATGSGAIAETLTVNETIAIKAIYLHLSATGTTVENLTVNIDSDAGTAYDTNLLTVAMAPVQNIVDTTERIIPSGDDIDIAYANTSARTWGLTIQYAKLGNL